MPHWLNGFSFSTEHVIHRMPVFQMISPILLQNWVWSNVSMKLVVLAFKTIWSATKPLNPWPQRPSSAIVFGYKLCRGTNYYFTFIDHVLSPIYFQIIYLSHTLFVGPSPSGCPVLVLWLTPFYKFVTMCHTFIKSRDIIHTRMICLRTLNSFSACLFLLDSISEKMILEFQLIYFCLFVFISRQVVPIHWLILDKLNETNRIWSRTFHSCCPIRNFHIIVHLFDPLVYHLPCFLLTLLIKLAVLWKERDRQTDRERNRYLSVHDTYTNLSINNHHSSYNLSVIWLLIWQRFSHLVLQYGLLLFFATKVSRLNHWLFQLKICWVTEASARSE